METDQETDLAETFARLTLALHGRQSVDRTLREVVDLAVPAVRGSQYAGVTLAHRHGRIDSPAFTHPLVEACDRVQAELGEGPCLEALDAEGVIHVADTATEERWPGFAQRAGDLGIRSMLACRLATGGGVLGSLNLHADRAGAFDDHAVRIAGIYAAHAGLALDGTRSAESMRAALETRQGIGEACGILIERHRITSRQAFTLLVRASQHLNVKLRDVAAHVVRTGQDPARITPADVARRQRRQRAEQGEPVGRRAARDV